MLIVHVLIVEKIGNEKGRKIVEKTHLKERNKKYGTRSVTQKVLGSAIRENAEGDKRRGFSKRTHDRSCSC